MWLFHRPLLLSDFLILYFILVIFVCVWSPMPGGSSKKRATLSKWFCARAAYWGMCVGQPTGPAGGTWGLLGLCHEFQHNLLPNPQVLSEVTEKCWGGLVARATCLRFISYPLPPVFSLAPSPTRLQPIPRLQRRVLLSGALQEKMVAVSNPCLHICQEVAGQEKMAPLACLAGMFFLTLYPPRFCLPCLFV